MALGSGYVFWIVVFVAVCFVAKLAKASAVTAIKFAIATVLVCSVVLYVIWRFMGQ